MIPTSRGPGLSQSDNPSGLPEASIDGGVGVASSCRASVGGVGGLFARTPTVLCIGEEAYQWTRDREDIIVAGYVDPFPRPENIPILVDDPARCAFGTWQEALENSRFDLAFQCVPNYAKNNLAMEQAILGQGTPIATTKLRLGDWDDAARLHSFAKSRNVPYFCRDHYHCAPHFQAARELLKEIGQVQSVCVRCSLPQGLKGFNPWTPSYRHLVLEDLAYHHFAILVFFFGHFDVQDGWCESRCSAIDGRTRNEVHLVAAMSGGWTLNYAARWGSRNPNVTTLHGEFSIEGSEGFLLVSENKLSLNGKTISPNYLRPAEQGFLSILTAGSFDEPMIYLEDYLPVARLIQYGLNSAGKP